jgi:hypothetical protein
MTSTGTASASPSQSPMTSTKIAMASLSQSPTTWTGTASASPSQSRYSKHKSIAHVFGDWNCNISPSQSFSTSTRTNSKHKSIAQIEQFSHDVSSNMIENMCYRYIPAPTESTTDRDPRQRNNPNNAETRRNVGGNATRQARLPAFSQFT